MVTNNESTTQEPHFHGDNMKCYKCFYMKRKPTNDLVSETKAFCLLSNNWCVEVIGACHVDRPVPQVNDTTLGAKK